MKVVWTKQWLARPSKSHARNISFRYRNLAYIPRWKWPWSIFAKMFIGSKLYQRLLDAFTTCHPDNGQVGFRSCFLQSELVGQWQDLFKGNLTLLLVLISCEVLLLRRSTKRAPMSCGWPSSWARMAVQVKIIWSRSTGCPKKTHFQNAVGVTVHWLNHKQPAPLVFVN